MSSPLLCSHMRLSTRESTFYDFRRKNLRDFNAEMTSFDLKCVSELRTVAKDEMRLTLAPESPKLRASTSNQTKASCSRPRTPTHSTPSTKQVYSSSTLCFGFPLNCQWCCIHNSHALKLFRSLWKKWTGKACATYWNSWYWILLSLQCISTP